VVDFQLPSALSLFLLLSPSNMPPKSKPTQSAANRGVSAARGGRGTRGGRGGGRGGRATTTTSAASQPDQEEVSISLAEVEAMKAELEKLRKASNAEAKKAAEAKRKIGESLLNFIIILTFHQSPGRELQIGCLKRWKKRKRKRIPLRELLLPSALGQTHFCRMTTLMKMNKLLPKAYHLFPPPDLLPVAL